MNLVLVSVLTGKVLTRQQPNNDGNWNPEKGRIKNIIGEKQYQSVKQLNHTYVIQFCSKINICVYLNQELYETRANYSNYVDFFFLDCSIQENYHLCEKNKVSLLPEFVLYNSNQIVNSPITYKLGKIISHDLVYKWALNNSKSPFIIVNSVYDLNSIIFMREKYNILATSQQTVDSVWYNLAKTQEIILFEYNESDKAEMLLYEIKFINLLKTDLNFISCSKKCDRFEGESMQDFKKFIK